MIRLLRALVPLALLSALWVAGRTEPAAHTPSAQRRDSWELVDEGPWRSAPCVWSDGGQAHMACIEHQFGEGDRLVSHVLLEDGLIGRQEVQSQPGEILHPAGVHAAGVDHLVWTELRDSTPDDTAADDTTADDTGLSDEAAQLWWSRRIDGRWSSPVRLQTPGCRADHPSLVAFDGQAWLAWRGWEGVPETEAPDAPPRQGGYDVFLAPLEADGLGAIDRATRDHWTDSEPALAAGAGVLWLAWSRYAGRDSEVMARSFQPGVGWSGPARSLSQDADCDDLHPSVVCDPDGRLWAAFDSVADPTRGRSLVRTEDEGGRVQARSQLRVVRWDAGSLQAAPGPGGAGSSVVVDREQLSWTGGLPRLALGPRGGLVLAHRRLDDRGGETSCHAYPVQLRRLGPDGWSDPIWLEHSEGAQEAPSLCAHDGGFVVAAQRDQRHFQVRNRLTVPPDPELSKALDASRQMLTGVLGPSGIQVQHLDWPELEAELALVAAPEPVPGPRDHALGTPEVDDILSGRRHHLIEHQGVEYKVYWGDLHRHSSVSRCLNGASPSPDDRYAFGRDIALYDFFALTDHSGHIDPYQWWQLHKRVGLHQNPRFVTFSGYEWSTFKYGHQNVILRDRELEVISPSHALGRDPKGLYALLEEGTAITIPHHSAHGRTATDWSQVDTRYLRLVEIYQAARGNFEFNGCWRQAEVASATGHFVQDALEMGHHFGLIASTDHGSGASYAAVLAPTLDRHSLFDALYDRRTYGATTKGILMDFRIDGHLMGSQIQAGDEAPKISLHAIGTRPLADVRIFRNGKTLFGRGDRSMVGDEENILALRWWSREEDEQWKLELIAEEGHFEFVDSQDAEARRHHTWQLLDEGRRLLGEYSGKARSNSPQRRFRYHGPESSAIQVTVQGSSYRSSIQQLKRRPLRATYQRTRWILETESARREEITLGGGSSETETFVDRRDQDFPAEGAWYYARVIQDDGEMAWSSPIRVSPRD